jgi:hypothetical protein
MSREFDAITALVYSCQTLNAQDSRNCIQNLVAFLENYGILSNDLSGQQRRQAWFVGAFGVTSGILGMAAEFIPNSPAAPAASPRLNAQAGITDPITNILKGIQKHLTGEQLKQMCKTTSTALGHAIPNAADAWFRSGTTIVDGKRQICKDVGITHSLGEVNANVSANSSMEQTIRSIQQAQQAAFG